LGQTLKRLGGYRFDVSWGSVPQAICFLESTDFEDAIRNAVSLGGDSDTIACITGIAEASSMVVRAHCQPSWFLDQLLSAVTREFRFKYELF